VSDTSITSHQNASSSHNGDDSDHHDEIAKLAYQYYEQRGRADGNHEGDWHKAEQEFRKMHQERSTVVGHVA